MAICLSACQDYELAADTNVHYTSILHPVLTSLVQMFNSNCLSSILFIIFLIKIEQAFSSGKDTAGAMTYTLIKAIKEKPNITYAGLLDYMHEAIESVNRTRNRVLKIFQPKMEQVLLY